MMAEIQNTIDLLGDEEVTKAIIERTITEFNDDVLTSIGKYAFYSCEELTSVNLPNVKSIPEYSFAYCSALVSVDIPLASSMGQRAFEKCTSLTSVNLPKASSFASAAFGDCSSLQSIILPSYISSTALGFQSCTSLKYADFPLATSLGSSIFRNCSILSTVILRNSAVCTLASSGGFDGTPFAKGNAGGTLLVPRALVTEYPNETNWSSLFANNANNRVLALEDYTVDGTITGVIDWDKLNGGN